MCAATMTASGQTWEIGSPNAADVTANQSTETVICQREMQKVFIKPMYNSKILSIFAAKILKANCHGTLS